MNLSKAAIKILQQLNDLVSQIEESDFARASALLSGATIGQHVRHTVEFFQCFEAGYHLGVINYDKRPHDKRVESDRGLALEAIRRCAGFVKELDENRPLKLEAGYDPEQDRYVSVDTNTLRELIYNIEHAVHHMAIIKMSVREIAPYVSLPADFGTAASTVRFNLVGTPKP